jgi:tetratricopeptide (TPR) repeat protein
MKISVPVLALMMATGALGADRHKPDIDAESQDGILLQRIQQEPTQPRKLALLEKFVVEYPQATSIAWVYEQLLPIYMEANQWDRVIAAAEGLLAADPKDLDSAHDALKAAEALNNPDLIAKYAELAWDLATSTLKTPKPADPEDVPDWNKQMDFARENLSYSEYTLAIQAAGQTDEVKRAELTLALQQRNPQSQFLFLTKKPTVIELASLNPAKALQLAEQGLIENPDNIDFLMTIADHDMSLEKNLPQVLSYALRILELVQGKPHRLGQLAGGRRVWKAGALRALGSVPQSRARLCSGELAAHRGRVLLSGVRQLRPGGRAGRQGPRHRGRKIQQVVRRHGFAFPVAGAQEPGSAEERVQRRVSPGVSCTRFSAPLAFAPSIEAS